MPGKRFLFGGACVAVLLAYRYGYSRSFIDGAPTSMNIAIAVMHFIGDVTELMSLLGMGDSLVLKARVLNSIPLSMPVPDSVTATDVIFDGVPVRIYSPQGVKAESPGIVYFHGGGWMIGSVNSLNGLCGEVANTLGIPVVSVEYRKAPDYPFPVPFDDCVRATVHLLLQGKDYGLDPARLAVMGDSSGANLAAAVAIKLRDDKVLPLLAAQVLLNPPLQGLDFATPSYQDGKKAEATLTVLDMVSFWLYYGKGHARHLNAALRNEHVTADVRKTMATSYLNHSRIDKTLISGKYKRPNVGSGNEEVWNDLKDVFLNPYFSPLIASDLGRTPAAFMLVCEYDPLRDDGLLYAKRLQESGVKVDLLYSSTGYHGITSMPYGSPEIVKIKKRIFDFLKNNL